jgi:hypothetical protein
MAIYLGNTAIGNGNYLGNLNIRDSNIFMSQSVAAPAVSGIQMLAVSSSLYAYYDVAFTASYSGSAQTIIFDLSGNNKSGSVVGTWNYNTAGISGSVLRLGTSANTNTIDMPTLTLSGSTTFVTAWYMTSGSYQFDFLDLFGGTDPEYYGMFIGNNAGNSSRVLPSINDVYDIPATTSGIPSGSASSGSWHISQFSFNDATNVWNWSMDGITGSYTQTAALSNGTITPKFNFNNGSLPNRYLNSGSIMQVMALYTGSLSTSELLENHNSLKARYGL